MTTEQNTNKSRAVQVGHVMRAYREAFIAEGGRKGLTQDGLLQRMGQVDSDYAQRYSHATVSRWESGSGRPSVERLRAFGKALNLSDNDVAGLLLLAGLAPDFETAQVQAVSDNEDPASSSTDESGPPGALQPAALGFSLDARLIPGGIFRFLVFRFLLPGALIAGFHYLLSLLGWNNTWMPVICVAFALLVVMGQGFIFPDRSAGLREFYWISVFFVLTTPLLQFAPLGLDHYNFHLVPGFGMTMMAYMLALLTNLGLAWVAGLMFYLLWRWRYRDGTSIGGTVSGAAAVTIPPLGVVYAVVLVITNFSVTVQLSVVFAALTMAFSLLLYFRDTGVTIMEQDQRALFQVMVTAACVSTAVGIAVIMSIYLSPDFPSVLPDHNLVRSWELDFDALGYTRQEAWTG